MNKKTLKTLINIICVALIAFMLVTAFSSVFAIDYTNVNNYKASASDSATKAQSIMNKVIGFVQVIAMGVAVVMLVVLGIKYLAASPSEKADIKKGITIYVVGAIMLFGATAILQFIKTMSSALNV